MTKLLTACAVLFTFASALHAQTWACESTGGTYRECRIGSSGVVRLVMEMSDRQCFEGSTWGTREGGVVWVDRGCRATFAVDTSQNGTRIICESLNGARAVCSATTTKAVGLARQLSKAECFEGQSWGYDPDRSLIWVDQGCRGEFTISRPLTKQPLPPTLNDQVVCESGNGARKDCPADTSSGVQIVRQLSNTTCRFGQEWGYDAKAIWVTKNCRAEFVVRNKPKAMARAIVCESKNNARTQCPADTKYGVAFVRTQSDNACVLGKSWGFDDAGVWVAENCRAQFALGGYRLPAEAVPPTAAKVVCESLDGKRIDCPALTARGVGLVRQISETDCVLNRSWGYGPDTIWVADGCRAEFVVAK
jgi:hypothetical protein